MSKATANLVESIPVGLNDLRTYNSKYIPGIQYTEDVLKEEKIVILKEYNKYLSFMEKYFSNKNAEPLPIGSELSKHIFG